MTTINVEVKEQRYKPLLDIITDKSDSELFFVKTPDGVVYAVLPDVTWFYIIPLDTFEQDKIYLANPAEYIQNMTCITITNADIVISIRE